MCLLHTVLCHLHQYGEGESSSYVKEIHPIKNLKKIPENMCILSYQEIGSGNTKIKEAKLLTNNVDIDIDPIILKGKNKLEMAQEIINTISSNRLSLLSPFFAFNFTTKKKK